MRTPSTLTPRARALAFAALLALLGCGDDESTSPGRPPELADAAAEGGEREREVASTLTDLYTHYDAMVEANCPCFVEMGAYPTIDECLMWQASRPEWAACTAQVVAEQPSEGLEVFKCMDRLLEATSKCLATKPCDASARAECDPNVLPCTSDAASAVGLQLSMRCPDIGLFPRLP